MGSTTSSGRRSAAFSNIYGEKYGRQGSIIASGKASIASGSLASTGLPIPEAIDTANLTPQQLGVMGKWFTNCKYFNTFSLLYWMTGEKYSHNFMCRGELETELKTSLEINFKNVLLHT